MKYVTAFMVVLFATGDALAALHRYKEWPSSPEAYFLTDGERALWSQLTTDDQAQRFVAAYMTRRGKGFAQELKRRIEIADQHLSHGRTPGSRTLRGRIIILFGPPTKMERIGGPQVTPDFSQTSDIYTNVGPNAGVAAQYRVRPYTYRFVYSGEMVTKRFMRAELVFRIDIDPSRGTESMPDRKEAAAFRTASAQIARESILADGSQPYSIASYQ